MDEERSFENFFDSISLDSLNGYRSSIESLSKALNEEYYDSDSVDEHCLVVGSVGRQTAVSNASDLDLLFILPHEVYARFDAYESNGQSALLQEVKTAISRRCPKMNVKADGQAVVIGFTDRGYSIDMVPAFEQTDGSFIYPDSNKGGSWKRTDPVPEQDACSNLFKKTDGDGKRLCNALRIWKNALGFHFKGLLIDTLVDNFYKKICASKAHMNSCVTFLSFYPSKIASNLIGMPWAADSALKMMIMARLCRKRRGLIQN